VDVALGGILGCPVEGSGIGRFVLRRRNPGRIAVDRHRAGKNEPWHTEFEAVFEDLDRAPDVDSQIFSWIRVGELDRRLSGDVENRIRNRIEGKAKIVVGPHIATNEIGGPVDVALAPGAFVVNHAH